jgi:CheY-like chemotaxis protein
MSHEIRTPINGVIGLNALLMRTPLSAEQSRLAAGVQVAGQALLAVINDVLDFSKIEAGKLHLERLDFEVRAVFDQVAGLLAEQARSKRLELIVSCHPDVPEVLAGDPTRLAQVLTNLGSNAVKFTEDGEVFIRATAGAGADGGTVLRVEVADTGVGVEAERAGHLFDPFTQADASTTRVYGGTGLGLAISREIVAALGGTIGMDPNPGGGSVFWFTAPFDEPDGSSTEPDDEHARSWLHDRRVLVVDDNHHNRLVLQEQLAQWRVRSITAADADEASAALARAAAEGHPVDGVLLDLMMPGRDGLDLAEEIRGNPAYDHLTLFLLVPLAAPDDERAAACRIDECLTKPVLSGQLRTALLRGLAGVEPISDDEPAEAAGAGHHHRVLVVEDNPVNRMVAIGMLEGLGCVVETAEDGVVALEMMAQRDFDVVLMDVQMPRMDGYAATRELRLRERDGRIPVIALTAAAVEGERERCLASGMDDFLTKPIDLSALRTVLNRWTHDDGGQESHPQHDTEADERETIMTDGLDVTRLNELLNLDPGDTKYLDRAIGNFVANTPATMATIREAYANGEPDTLRQVSHKLAGGALNLGLPDVGQIAQQIELVADTGSVAGAEKLVDELDAALTTGREALLAYQASYAG